MHALTTRIAATFAGALLMLVTAACAKLGFNGSSQPLRSKCCDDHVNPPTDAGPATRTSSTSCNAIPAGKDTLSTYQCQGAAMTSQQAGKHTGTIALVQGGVAAALVVIGLMTFNTTILGVGALFGLAGVVSGRKANHQGATALSGTALTMAVLTFVYFLAGGS